MQVPCCHDGQPPQRARVRRPRRLVGQRVVTAQRLRRQPQVRRQRDAVYDAPLLLLLRLLLLRWWSRRVLLVVVSVLLLLLLLLLLLRCWHGCCSLVRCCRPAAASQAGEQQRHCRHCQAQD